ncbi:MAG: GNAT family N-acetyltransferase [Ignavibacteriales bacterium]|nr:GNAT family N-acetyltransferase [Ignavibacteriales bacterium]
MIIKLINTVKDFQELQQKWTTLHSEANGTIFQSYRWNYEWWKIYYQPNYELRIVTFWEDNKLVGLIPFHLEYLSLGVTKLKRMRFIGIYETYGEYAPLINPNFDSKIIEAFKEFCINQLRANECELISMFRFSPKSNSMLSLIGKMKNVGIKTKYAPDCITRIMMPLPNSWDKYLESISPNENHLLQRRMRALNKDKVELEVLKGENITDQDFSDFVKLHTVVWEEKGIAGYYSSSRFKEFHRTLTTQHQLETNARLYFFKKDEKRFAAVQIYFMNDTCCFYLSGMDRHHPLGNQSPGKVLLSFAIKDAISEGYKYFDFQGGDEQYKIRLGGAATSFAKFEIWKKGKTSIKIILLNILQWLRRTIYEIILDKLLIRPFKIIFRKILQ